MPAGWDVFTGIPGGDPGGHFSAQHVKFGGGMMHLNTWRDPAYGDGWITGGICQCGHSQIYGAYFVRSRNVGPGPNDVELLWPATNLWPPEIDFNETGGNIAATSETVHYGTTNTMIHGSVRINMSRWHTWGVIWTSSSTTYIVDGRVWDIVRGAYAMPHVAMTLDFEQRTICSEDRQCPTQPAAMLVDWVAEYTPAPPSPATTTTTLPVTATVTVP